MIEMFIAAFVVLGFMSLFIFLILRKSIQHLNDKVKGEFIKNLTVYDEIIDEKSEHIRKLNEQKENLSLQDIEEPKELAPALEVITPIVIERANYIDLRFFEYYNRIKKEFTQPSYDAAKIKVQELSRLRKDINVHEYKELQELFSHELQYQILTLVGQDEKSVFDLIAKHSHAKKKILDSYTSHHKNFDFMEFMLFVKDYIRTHDSIVYVYSRDGYQLLEDTPKHVVYLCDKTIHEGYRICYRDIVFDYSL